MNLENLIEQMTLEEQVSLLSGQDFWSINRIARLGIGELHVTDGPNGARGGGSFIGGARSACFPCGIALGATWNPDLLMQVGEALADEVKAKGAQVLLAPTVNLHRSATNGRNFECYSEDAVLTAALAVSYIEGLQSNGIGATIKHFVGNESEVQRNTISSEIDERTLREHYLYPFEMAVKKAKTWAIMSSYNRLNGTFTSEHEWLLNQVLREEWKYQGIVMSDWFGSSSTAPTINAGLNLEMPGPSRDRGSKLIAAVRSGDVSAERIKQLATDVLSLMKKAGVLAHDKDREEVEDNRPEHRALIRRAACEAMVLLKNDHALPLPAESKIALIGPNAKTAQIMGGGSAQLNPYYAVSPYDGLVSAVGEQNVKYQVGCRNNRFEPLIQGEFKVRYFDNLNLAGEPVFSETVSDLHAFLMDNIADGAVQLGAFSMLIEGEVTVEKTGNYQLGAFSAGYLRVFVNDQLQLDISESHWRRGTTFFEEGCEQRIQALELVQGQTLSIRIEFTSKSHNVLGINGYRIGLGIPSQDDDIHAAVELAKQCEVAVVCVGRNGEWDTESCDLPHIELPDRQNELVSAVAAVNPKTIVVLQTGGPVTMPWLDDVDAVLQAWYPGQEAGNAIADVLLGEQEPSGRLPQTFPVSINDVPTTTEDPLNYPGKDGRVRYQEGEYFGYRHYDKHNIAPLFEFGFGLGYSTFDMANLTVSESSEGYKLVVNVQNIGERQGNTVVQVYVRPTENTGIDRAKQALKAFAKCSITAGDSADVELNLSWRDFAYFDTTLTQWHVPAGDYEIAVGFSSRDIRQTQTLTNIAKRYLPV